MYVHMDLAKCSDSVCQIRFPGGTGTGFRVGSRYIMTALHVVKEILDSGKCEYLVGFPNFNRSDRRGNQTRTNTMQFFMSLFA